MYFNESSQGHRCPRLRTEEKVWIETGVGMSVGLRRGRHSYGEGGAPKEEWGMGSSELSLHF